MVSENAFVPKALRKSFHVCIGKSEKSAGRLIYAKDGSREFSQFTYDEQWLQDPLYFDISPDLARQSGFQLRKPPTKNDSCFFYALADTEPDAWGRRVIARAHAKARSKDSSLGPLTEIDYLAAVDDHSRMGALRLRDDNGHYLRATQENQESLATIIDLEKILHASRAVELSKETEEDLRYLQGRGTSLGGMRPKCTFLEVDGSLALGKFPSVSDERSVTRGEVLALQLAKLAEVNSADSRVVMAHGLAVAVIRRFDRTHLGERIPYISAATLLQANRDEDHSYTELVDIMRMKCKNFANDAKQLWRRILFNHLITNVDDHLQNLGFLYAGNNQWKLSPAFDLNPFPDKDRESKTWLSEDTGPITSVAQLLDQARRFELTRAEAIKTLHEVIACVEQWKKIAVMPEVGMAASELQQFRPAFEGTAIEEARALAI